MALLTQLLIGVSIVGGVGDGPGSSTVVADTTVVIQQVDHSYAAPAEAWQTTCNPCHVSNPCDPCSWCNPCLQCSHGMKWSDCVECNACSPALKYSTCNLYPHYPYFPESHGYWHFRAYNWIHIDQHRLTIAGEDFKFPYSNKIFDQVYADFKLPLGDPNTDHLEAIRKDRMPLLEDLLKKVPEEPAK